MLFVILISTGTPLNTDPTIAASSRDVCDSFAAVSSPILLINKSRDGIHAHRQAHNLRATDVSMKCSTEQSVAVNDDEKVVVSTTCFLSVEIYDTAARLRESL